MSVTYQKGIVSISLSGFEELAARLDDLEANIRKRLLVNAMKTSLLGMMRTAEAKAPIGKPYDLFGRPRATGRLKRSFKIIKPRSAELYALEIHLINTSYTARWVEHGHNLVRKIGGKKTVVGWVPPNPFMRPAFEAHKAEAINTLGNLIRAGLNKRGV